MLHATEHVSPGPDHGRCCAQVKAQYQSTNRFADASGTISSFVIAPECGHTAAVAG